MGYQQKLKRILITIILHSSIVTTENCKDSPFRVTDDQITEFQHELKGLVQNDLPDASEGLLDVRQISNLSSSTEPEEYDFIIVGSGASGSVIANRLSEIPEWKIFLLEAGAPETPYSQVPAFTNLLKSTSYNWGYKSIPQKASCLGMIDNKCTIICGKALGGSTVLNSMLYTRGNLKDYDLWADQGNQGWCYDDVLHYFKESENSHLSKFDRKFHHQGGLLNVEELQMYSNLTDLFLKAANELRYDILDYNGKEQLGFGKSQATTRQGRRNSAAKAYLAPIADRPNLVVKTLSHVTELLISHHTKEVHGVKFVHNNELQVAKATKEVILAAGAINSPHLLLLSGIGPKEKLEELQIPLVHDLHVGAYLKDQVTFLGLNFIVNENSVEDEATLEDIVYWLQEGRGPFAAIDVEAVGFVKTSVSQDTTDYPDVELLFAPNTNYLKYWKVKQEIDLELWKPLDDYRTFSILVALTHPKSSGSVGIKSKNPYTWPLIDLNHFSDPDEDDIDTMVAGIEKAISLTQTPAFQNLGVALHKSPVPKCKDHEFASKAYWTCAVKYISVSLGEMSGTCRMGPKNDKFAVVDDLLRVHGVHKLRVADASVIPVSIAGQLHATVVMIGERAAELIKTHWT